MRSDDERQAAPRARRRGLIVAVVSLLGATLFWAGNYVVGADAVAALDSLSLVTLRWLIAVIPLLAVAQLLERPNWKAAVRTWPWLIAQAMFGLLGYNLLLYGALQHTTAFDASLVNAFNPALITLAAALLLRERLTPRAVFGVVLALAGVLLVLSDGDPGALLVGGVGTGQAFMLGAIVAWTAYTITGRRAPKVPPITSTALQALIVVAILSPFSLATGGPTLPSTMAALTALLFIGIFPSVLSYLLWNRALTVLPAAKASVFLNLITVFTAAFAIFGGHGATIPQLLGGLVVIGGVAIASTPARARTIPAHPTTAQKEHPHA